MAVWTQSTGEGQPDQHIAFSRSADGGKTWAKPRVIAGPAKAGQGHIASWAFPLVSRGGCLVQSDFGLMDLGIGAQMSEMSRALLDSVSR